MKVFKTLKEAENYGKNKYSYNYLITIEFGLKNSNGYIYEIRFIDEPVVYEDWHGDTGWGSEEIVVTEKIV